MSATEPAQPAASLSLAARLRARQESEKGKLPRVPAPGAAHPAQQPALDAQALGGFAGGAAREAVPASGEHRPALFAGTGPAAGRVPTVSPYLQAGSGSKTPGQEGVPCFCHEATTRADTDHRSDIVAA